MAITEHARHQLYKHLEELMGAEDASTLMEHLPPVGWADVATRRDLDAMEQRLRLEWRADLANGLRVQGVALLGGFSVIATILELVGR